MDLGAVSISLAVQDVAASRGFYGRLGFSMVGGDGESWTILANGTTLIGLFHGMLEGNVLTFNPGWTGVAEPLDEFTDIREIAARLRSTGVEIGDDTTAQSPGDPASFTLTDPHGNAILIDQHV